MPKLAIIGLGCADPNCVIWLHESDADLNDANHAQGWVSGTRNIVLEYLESRSKKLNKQHSRVLFVDTGVHSVKVTRNLFRS